MAKVSTESAQNTVARWVTDLDLLKGSASKKYKKQSRVVLLSLMRVRNDLDALNDIKEEEGIT